MSKNFLPLVNLVVDSGRIPTARGLIKGNRLQVEMAVAALKSSEVTQAWLRERDLMPADAGASPLAAPEVADDPIEQATVGASVDSSLSSNVEGGGREPGFYGDPEGMADERFWDGFEWTSRIRMRPQTCSITPHSHPGPAASLHCSWAPAPVLGNDVARQEQG